MHEVLVNRLGGLSLPRKSVVRLTDRPDMTLDVNLGRKTTMQQQQSPLRYWLEGLNELNDPKRTRKYNLHYDNVRGEVLLPPHPLEARNTLNK